MARGPKPKKANVDNMPARFEAGTFDRIDQNLRNAESRADFLRQAVEAELRRRVRDERRQQSKTLPPPDPSQHVMFPVPA